ncbi:unnamed protein product [Lampetra planeri]
MTDVEEAFAEFVASGRSGRRNALPDILGSPSGSTNPELPLQLSELSIKSGKPTQCTSMCKDGNPQREMQRNNTIGHSIHFVFVSK